MPIRAVTFDCAETLIRVDWSPERFAVASAVAAGLELPIDAGDVYRIFYYARINEFIEANLRRDQEAADKFYRSVCERWLERMGIDPARADDVMREADRLAFGRDSILFEPFSDALPCIEKVREMGLKVAVLSNWDYTLHRVLDVYGFSPLLDFALASLEEGFEKPDPRFFDIALARLECDADEVLHVGDNAIDDVEGAIEAGMHPCLIDRRAEASLPHRVESLAQVPEAIAWIG